MPLAERNINMQHHLPLTRRKRLPASRSVMDENAALPPTTSRAKDSPTNQQRFLAPTKASVAKNTPPPSTDPTRLQPPSSKRTPSPYGSKLPRRNAATPTPKSPLSPPISKWNRSVATDCIDDSNSPAETPTSTYPSPPSETADDHSLIALDSLPRSKPRLRVEKPLPPRPIASLAYAPSPSRDSRCLMDASERPLRLSRGESEYDWPTLMPTSSSTPTLGRSTSHATMTDTTPNPLPMSASAISMTDITPDANSASYVERSGSNIKISGSPEQKHSSLSSYTSTSELGPTPDSAGSPEGATQPQEFKKISPNGAVTSPPPRKSSLSSPYSHGLLIERSRSTGANTGGSPEFARDMFEASRPHSPSPASFSRPRPTSISQVSIPMTPPAVVDVTPIKSEKTASRIPWPDQKKATLVDIKGRRASSIPMPKFEKGLSFGGRRFDSPDPLKVLDHGIKRRQLKRDGSSSTVSTVPTGVLSQNTFPTDRTKTNTPESTRCSTTEDEEEVTTPSDKPHHFVKHGYKPKHVNRVSGSHYAGATLKVYDEAEVVLGRPPPSNSPFTGPLQTIPSQSLLPLRPISTRYSLEAEPHPKVVIKPTEFSAFAQRLSVLEGSRNLGTNDTSNTQNTIGDDAKSELVDILREAEHEDALISQCGATGLDEETKEEVTRTLSMLEGTCGPTNTNVDLEHLSRMFGRLKSGFEKAPKSAAFVEDATVADRFLARRGGTSSDQVIRAQANGYHEAPIASHRKGSDADSQHSRSKTVASKWSTSTASAKERSFPSSDTSTRQNTLSMEFDDFAPGPPPKDSLHSQPTSIGYPSRVPGKAHWLLGTDGRETINPKCTGKARQIPGTGERETIHLKSTARRSSSPTLGNRVPGSVRAAREKARDSAGSRANQASTTKVERLPTPNTKVNRLSTEPTRGRLPSADKSTNRGSTKPPRSRSKSRYVFDKINGLFSGRRDRRESKLPPVPPVKDSFDHTRPHVAPKEEHTSSLGSPVLPSPKITPLTKMPTISPPVDSVHPALRSAPSSASVAPSTTTVGSDTDYAGRRSLQALSEKLLGRAMRENDPARKERLLNFAKVLNDSLISAREAQISAETAQSAARSAQLSYEMTMRSVAMLQRLASSMNRR